MAEVGRFSQRISLEGLEEIKKGLEEIGLTGTKAFKEVEKAIDASNTRLTGINAIVAQAQAGFVKFGQGITAARTATIGLGSALTSVGSTLGTLARNLTAVSGIGVALSIGGATAALVGFVKASAEAGEQVLQTSQSLGLSVEAYQRLAFAAQQSGINQEQFARGMANLNKLIVEGANLQQKALLDLATGIKNSMGQAGQTVDELRAKIGPTFQQITEAARALQQQLAFRGITEIPLAVLTEHLRRLATGSAEARKQYQLLTSGLGAPLPLTNLERFGISVDTASNALLRLGIRLTDIVTGKPRDPEEIIDDLADAFARIPNPTERAALAMQLFTNRGRQFANLLLEGSEGLRRFKEEFRGGFDRPGAEAADRLTAAFASLVATLRNTRNQLAAPLFAPLERAFKAIQQVIRDNRLAIADFGQTIARNVTPFIEDFVRLISGKPVETELFKGLISGAKELGSIIDRIPAVFRALIGALDQVAGAINKVFGTDLKAADLAIVAFIGQITGFNTALGQLAIAFGIVGLALIKLTALLLANPFTALVVAAGIAAALIILNWEKIAPFVEAANERIARSHEEAYRKATEASNRHFAEVRRDMQAMADFIVQAWERVINVLTNAREIGSSIGGNIPGMEGAPFAGGGFVRGPGSATSDSILARLSSGEFVIRAAAVKHFGAEFFAALNALRAPRFDMGGLVAGLNRSIAHNFAVPGFAPGGLVTGSGRGDLHPVTINLGGRQIAGLLAPPDVIQELRRAAINEQYLSAGRKTI